MKRAIVGKKGQKFLLELETALLALPEKRLAHGVFAKKVEDDPSAAVCALGAVALKRKMDAGVPREKALEELVSYDLNEDEYGGNSVIWEAAHILKISNPLAYSVVERNDERGGKTPEETYTKVLAWVREKLKAAQ